MLPSVAIDRDKKGTIGTLDARISTRGNELAYHGGEGYMEPRAPQPARSRAYACAHTRAHGPAGGCRGVTPIDHPPIK